jgi:hypothetical protein
MMTTLLHLGIQVVTLIPYVSVESMLNNRKLVSTGLIILGSMTTLILLDVKSSQAEVTRYRSRDGNLTIQYEQCSTSRVFGSYQVGNSTSGILTAQNCIARGDTIQYQFTDETGGE